eukprot:COSAG05_NODE_579_length_8556_cov_44.773679_19_plen_60_part_00
MFYVHDARAGRNVRRQLEQNRVGVVAPPQPRFASEDAAAASIQARYDACGMNRPFLNHA